MMLKFKLYGDFDLGRVLPNPSNLDDTGTHDQITFDVARQSATLISPSQDELDETVPDPPNNNDRIVIVSDTRTAQQCSDCPM